MSVTRLEERLATLLSTAELPVGTGVAAAGGASTVAAVAVTGVTPRVEFAARLPAEVIVPRSPHRVSSVTVRAVVSIGAAGGASGRAEALEAATVLWWRCEDGPVASGSGFPADDLTEGYRVLEVRPVGWVTPETTETADAAVPVHRIALDVDALVWPRTATPQAGPQIDHLRVRLTGALAGVSPVRVRAGNQVEVGVEIDMRSFVVHPGSSGDPAPPPREVAVAVVPLGDTPAGSVAQPTVPVTGDRAVVGYTAGVAPGRDELRFTVLLDGADALPLGTVPVEVVS